MAVVISYKHIGSASHVDKNYVPNYSRSESRETWVTWERLYALLIASFKEMSVKREREFKERGKWIWWTNGQIMTTKCESFFFLHKISC